MFVVIIICYVFCSFKFLEETFALSNYFFASFINQEGSDCLILTFLLGMCLSASSEIRLFMFDAYISISLLFLVIYYYCIRLNIQTSFAIQTYRQNWKKVQTYHPPKLSQHIHRGK